MAHDWPVVKLKSLYKVSSRNGLTKPKKVRGNGYKFINMGEIFAYNRMMNIPCDRVPMTDKEKSNSFLEDGDLLFARQSLVLSGAGKCAIFLGDDEQVTFESHLIRVRLDKEKVNPEYAFYYFNSPQGRANIATIVEQGAGQAGIRGSDLENLDFPLPPKEAQDFIADMVRPTDIKIEVNQETNQTLEAMAQALFKSWFVDYDPVIDNALAAGHEIPESLQARAEQRKAFLAFRHSREGGNPNDTLDPHLRGDDDMALLPESIRQLFPNRFVLDAEMGWIPEGWETQPVSSALVVNPKVKLPKGTLARYVDMKALPTSGYSISEVIDKEYSGGAKFEQYDVLLARITPCLENGKTGFVDFLSAGEVGFGSTEFIVLRKKGHIGYAFVACLSREESFRQHCVQNMVGSSGRQRVQNSCFDSYRLALPSESDLLALFESQVKPMFAKKSANKNEVVKLVQLRDTLLPKLISGELCIPDAAQAEQQLEAVSV